MTYGDVLKRYFGYERFRPMQEDIVKTLTARRDVTAIMPTGAGKSVCYQLPALLFPHGTVILSPLISLMKDQVEALKEQGIPADFVNSTVSFDDSIERLRALYRGELKMLYMAPEKLEPSYFTHCLSQVPLSMLVIDEAHCVSQWGHDFRPSYGKIKSFVEGLSFRPVVAAFTATATPLVEADMKKSLGLEQSVLFKGELDRPNLFFRVLRVKDKKEFILRYVRSHEGKSGIIYCATRKAAEEVWAYLSDKGMTVAKYHAGLDDASRRLSQDAFSFDKASVMVATNAFGMGIDKSNVRYVLHYQMPKSLEAYYQEAGRAGRDGAAAECILLYSDRDAGVQRYLLSESDADATRRQADEKRLSRMLDYCHTSDCLRNHILSYFGEKPATACGHCGNCEAAHGKTDMTETAILVLRTVLGAGEAFGASVVASVLKGSRNQSVLSRHLERLPTYGRLSPHKIHDIRLLIDGYVADGYLLRWGEPYPVLKISDKGKAVLDGRERVTGFIVGANGLAAASTVKPTSSKTEESHGDILFRRLAALRTSIAEEEHVPPFVIFSDATLEDMCLRLPKNEKELHEVHGVGAFKLQKYGFRFLHLLKEARRDRK